MGTVTTAQPTCDSLTCTRALTVCNALIKLSEAAAQTKGLKLHHGSRASQLDDRSGYDKTEYSSEDHN